MASRLAGQSAIVTGASSGINLCFARNLLSRGCNVLIADQALSDEAQKLVSNDADESQAAGKAFFQPTDVRDWSQLERMFQTADKEFGGVDIVCPGAGVYEPPWSNFWHPPGCPPSNDSPIANSYAMLDISLTHPIRTTQLALSHFSKASQDPKSIHPKSIIHISSISGQRATLATPIYNAAKAGINNFVRSLGSLDERLGIRVVAVAPGIIKTPLWTSDKLKLMSKEDEWVTPEFTADVMTSLVEQDTVEALIKEENQRVPVEGGLILEIGKQKIRVVEPFNDPGPSGAGNTVGNLKERDEEVFEMLQSGRWGWNDFSVE